MFEHSLKVPQLYKVAAKIAKEVKEKNASLKDLVYQEQHVHIKALFALVISVCKHSKELELLLKKSQIVEKEPRLDPWLAKVLITELLWGKKRLPSESKPVKTVLAYQQIFNEHLSDTSECLEEKKTASKPRYVRVNTLLISVNEVVEGFRDEGWTLVRFMDVKNYNGFLEKLTNLGQLEFMVDIHIKELLIFPPKTQFYNHSAYKEGLILLQDKASCLPVYLLDPKPESTVLDMCAAPGMKTSQIACRLANKGKIYAVDINRKRLQAVDDIMEKCGITCTTTINKDIFNIKNKECPNVEYILIDPSCSGSGIVDRLELKKVEEVNEQRLKKLFGFQVMALKHAFRHFPSVKRVVYSTCSLNTQENERVVEEVITNCSAFKLVDVRQLMPNWFNFGSEEFGEIGKRCLYSRPEQDFTNGFFVAVFERLEDNEGNEFLNPHKQRIVAINKDVIENNEANKDNMSRRKKKRKKTKKDEFEKGSTAEKNNDHDKNEERHEITDNKNVDINNDIDKKTSKKKKKKVKTDDSELNSKDDNANIEQEEKIFVQKKHKRNKDNDKPKNQTESTEIQDEACCKNQCIRKKQKKNPKESSLSLLEEMCSENESVRNDIQQFPRKRKKNKNERIRDSTLSKRLLLSNEEEERQLIDDFPNKKKRHKKEIDVSCISIVSNDNSEEANKHFSLEPQMENEDNIQKSIKRDKKKKKKHRPSLVEDDCHELQNAEIMKSKSEELLPTEDETEEHVCKDVSKKKRRHKMKNNLDDVSAIDYENHWESIDVLENKNKQLSERRQKNKKRRSSLTKETVTSESSDFESANTKKRQKQLNKENFVIRESLSNFLQTLSSPGENNVTISDFTTYNEDMPAKKRKKNHSKENSSKEL